MPTFLELAGAPIPSTVEGRSILPLLNGGVDDWRPWYHGEHSPCYHPQNACQFLTDSRWKYIWNPITGEEQLFDLIKDAQECFDLAHAPSAQETLAGWRRRLAQHLQGRPEKLSDGERLTPGDVPVWRG
jgi:arylsulfatase A-like enzyme